MFYIHLPILSCSVVNILIIQLLIFFLHLPILNCSVVNGRLGFDFGQGLSFRIGICAAHVGNVDDSVVLPKSAPGLSKKKKNFVKFTKAFQYLHFLLVLVVFKKKFILNFYFFPFDFRNLT